MKEVFIIEKEELENKNGFLLICTAGNGDTVSTDMFTDKEKAKSEMENQLYEEVHSIQEDGGKVLGYTIEDEKIHIKYIYEGIFGEFFWTIQ